MSLETALVLGAEVPRPATFASHTSLKVGELLQGPLTDAATDTIQQLIDDLPEQIALLDSNCTIIAANNAWRDAAADYGYADLAPGHSFRDFCTRPAAKGYKPAIAVNAALDDIFSGERRYWQHFYNGQNRWAGRDYQICLHRLSTAPRTFISVTRYDLTDILRGQGSQHADPTSRIAIQTAERQRVSRELHDSASQLLTSIGLVLGRLRYDLDDSKSACLLDEMQELLSETHREIRAISYLGQPPALENADLATALGLLIDGFGHRSDLKGSFEVRGMTVALPPETEAALYRIAQEGLTNIHRHAHASQFSVLLHFSASRVHLVLSDNGVGISADSSDGVGISGMRNRLAELRGRLTIRDLSPGTAIIVSLPQTQSPTPRVVDL